MGSRFVKTPCRRRWRRRWDLNPRKVSLHTISNRADSAALALLHTLILTTRNEYRLARLPEPRATFSGILDSPRFKAVVGSRATIFREPSQGWKPAALSELCWVPRIA